MYNVCCYTLMFGMMSSAKFFEVLEVMEWSCSTVPICQHLRDM